MAWGVSGAWRCRRPLYGALDARPLFISILPDYIVDTIGGVQGARHTSLDRAARAASGVSPPPTAARVPAQTLSIPAAPSRRSCPYVRNAAEHAAAVIFAMKNRWSSRLA